MDKDKISIKTYDQIASAYQDKFMSVHLYDHTYDRFCSRIQKQGSRVFEIGCGPGNITKYLLETRPDFKIEAIDLAPNMIKLAKANNPGADFKVMDCRKIDQINSHFDAIICGFCMPYLSKEECNKLITDCSDLLNSGGIFYFSTIEGEYESSGYELSSNGQFKMYVYYYPGDMLKKWLEEHNFELVDEQRLEYPKGDGKQNHLIFIARKK